MNALSRFRYSDPLVRISHFVIKAACCRVVSLVLQLLLSSWMEIYLLLLFWLLFYIIVCRNLLCAFIVNFEESTF